jgi:septation ring formation regulator EzrA
MGQGNTKELPDPKEVKKQQMKIIRTSQRKIDREIKNLEKQEKKNIAEIKKMAQKGQHGPAKILAKDVARGRSTSNQYMMMSS